MTPAKNSVGLSRFRGSSPQLTLFKEVHGRPTSPPTVFDPSFLSLFPPIPGSLNLCRMSPKVRSSERFFESRACPQASLEPPHRRHHALYNKEVRRIYGIPEILSQNAVQLHEGRGGHNGLLRQGPGGDFAVRGYELPALSFQGDVFPLR